MRASAASTSASLAKSRGDERMSLLRHHVGDGPVVGLFHAVAQADQPRIVLRGAGRRFLREARAAAPKDARPGRCGRTEAPVTGRPWPHYGQAQPGRDPGTGRRDGPEGLEAADTSRRLAVQAAAARAPGRLPINRRYRRRHHGQSARLRPVRRSSSVHGRIAALLDDLFRGFFRPVRSERAAPAAVKIEVTELDKGYVVHAEIPGVSKDEIQVAVEGNQVTLSAQVKRNAETKDGERRCAPSATTAPSTAASRCRASSTKPTAKRGTKTACWSSSWPRSRPSRAGS